MVTPRGIRGIRLFQLLLLLWPHSVLYLSWLRVDHAYDVLPPLRPSVVGLAAGALGLFADVVAVATAQAEVHVADAPPQLRVATAVAPLTFLRPAP